MSPFPLEVSQVYGIIFSNVIQLFKKLDLFYCAVKCLLKTHSKWVHLSVNAMQRLVIKCYCFTYGFHFFFTKSVFWMYCIVCLETPVICTMCVKQTCLMFFILPEIMKWVLQMFLQRISFDWKDLLFQPVHVCWTLFRLSLYKRNTTLLSDKWKVNFSI